MSGRLPGSASMSSEALAPAGSACAAAPPRPGAIAPAAKAAVALRTKPLLSMVARSIPVIYRARSLGGDPGRRGIHVLFRGTEAPERHPGGRPLHRRILAHHPGGDDRPADVRVAR